MAFYSIEDFGFWSQDLGCPTIPDEEPGLELENSFYLLDMLSLHETYIITDWGLLDGRLSACCACFSPPHLEGCSRGVYSLRGSNLGVLGAVFSGDTYQELEGSALLRRITLESVCFTLW